MVNVQAGAGELQVATLRGKVISSNQTIKYKTAECHAGWYQLGGHRVNTAPYNVSSELQPVRHSNKQ